MFRLRSATWRSLVPAMIVIALLAGVLGVIVGRRIPSSYAATTTVLVGSLDRPSVANDFDTSGELAAIYARLIRSEAVLGPVIDRLGLTTTFDALRDRVHVDLDPNGIPIVTVTVYARTAAEATATAQGITDRMLSMSRSDGAGANVMERPLAADATSGSEQDITRVEGRLALLFDVAPTLPTADRARLERRIQRLSENVMLFQDDHRGVVDRRAGAANELEVLQPAAQSGGIGPVPPIDAGLAAAIAVLVGCAAIVAIRRRIGPAAPRGATVVPDAWASELTVAQQRSSGRDTLPLGR